MDSNKTITVYLTDSTHPTIGNISLNGFTIADTNISGTGTISAPVNDTGSGINYCTYRTDNGQFFTADYNGTHCTKTITTTPQTTYTFNFLAVDNAGNVIMGTPTTTYTDRTPEVIPSTTSPTVSKCASSLNLVSSVSGYFIIGFIALIAAMAIGFILFNINNNSVSENFSQNNVIELISIVAGVIVVAFILLISVALFAGVC
jgi:hypothetical protein